MYQLAKFCDHRSHRNRDINSDMDILEKAEVTASILHIAGFLKSGILIFNYQVPDTAARKTRRRRRRRRAQATVKRFVLDANTIKHLHRVISVIYTIKHLSTYFMTVTMSNVYGCCLYKQIHKHNISKCLNCSPVLLK